MARLVVFLTWVAGNALAFAPQPPQFGSHAALRSSVGDWNGDVVSNTPDGKIKGCTMQNVGNSATEWIIFIDGVEADLGKFSEAIYRKIIGDAKQQRFQGFRPGTIPPHLEPTYRAFAMDECAREATMEAMQQNNIRPFADARTTLEFADVSFPPSTKKASNKKSKRKKAPVEIQVVEEVVEAEPAWLRFESMKEAIDGGWKPGQSFSFVVKNVKGQKLKDEKVDDARPLGTGGIDFNKVAADAIRGKEGGTN